MLTITPDATQAIQALAESVPQESVGLRIFAQPTGDGQNEATLELALTEGPAAGDDVIDLPGTSVYLESNASAYLSDKILDADVEGESVRFSIGQEAGEAGEAGGNGEPGPTA